MSEHSPSTTGADAVAFWQGRYAEDDQVWSGEPNRALVGIVTSLPSGRALDLGCGEGGDSVWLAEHGWRVTAVDISDTAVTRAKARAEDHHIPGGQIRWLIEDLASWEPAGVFELVSACFLHSPVDFPRTEILRRAASTVEPAGHLLIVGHAEFPPWSRHDHTDHRFLSPAEEIAELQLADTAWDTVVSETRAREAAGPHGERATLDDTVVLLRRR